MKKLPLTRLLDSYETAAVEVLDDGSVLIHVESRHPDLMLATFAVPAEAVERFDLRHFPDPKLEHRLHMRERMRQLRADPAYSDRERKKSRERMRKSRKRSGGRRPTTFENQRAALSGRPSTLFLTMLYSANQAHAH